MTKIGAFIGLLIVGLLSAKLSILLTDKTDKYTRVFLSIGMFLLSIAFFMDNNYMMVVLQWFLPALTFIMYVDFKNGGKKLDVKGEENALKENEQQDKP